VCYRGLQCLAASCNVSQCVALCVAVCCSELQCNSNPKDKDNISLCLLDSPSDCLLDSPSHCLLNSPSDRPCVCPVDTLVFPLFVLDFVLYTCSWHFLIARDRGYLKDNERVYLKGNERGYLKYKDYGCACLVDSPSHCLSCRCPRLLATGWRRCIGCLNLHISFRKRATNNRALLPKMTSKDKASNDSTPTCIYKTNAIRALKTAQEASWKWVFDPVHPLLFDLY